MVTLTLRLPFIMPTFGDVCGLAKRTSNAIRPAQLAHGLIALCIIY